MKGLFVFLVAFGAVCQVMCASSEEDSSDSGSGATTGTGTGFNPDPLLSNAYNRAKTLLEKVDATNKRMDDFDTKMENLKNGKMDMGLQKMPKLIEIDVTLSKSSRFQKCKDLKDSQVKKVLKELFDGVIDRVNPELQKNRQTLKPLREMLVAAMKHVETNMSAERKLCRDNEAKCKSKLTNPKALEDGEKTVKDMNASLDALNEDVMKGLRVAVMEKLVTDIIKPVAGCIRQNLLP